MSNFLSGIDIASHQWDMDISKMDIDFVVIKATGGINYVNDFCDKHFQQAKRSNKLIGFYHYANEYNVKNDPIQEAKWFIKNTKNYFGEALPVLDFETEHSWDIEWAIKWLDYVYQETGVRPLLYTYTGIVNSYDFSPLFSKGYGLWIANYGYNGYETGFRKPYPPHSNGNPITVMYQYSSNTVISDYPKPIDVNVFYGDKEVWLKYVKGDKANEGIKPTYPDQEENKQKDGIKLKTLKTSVDGLRLRSQPEIKDSNILLQMSKGTTILIDDLVEKNGYLWAIQPRSDKTKGYIAICKTSESMVNVI